jgi:hypothetical protein
MKITTSQLKQIIREELMKEESGEKVKIENLSPDKQKQVKSFLAVIGGKIGTIWDSEKETILYINSNAGSDGYKFTPDVMKRLIALNPKYITAEGSLIEVRF